MFISHVIEHLIHEPVRYLDLCAAPGGKTTAALQALPAGSLVVANEIVPPRARVLADNIIRWGNPHCVVTSNAPAHFGKLTHFFDVIATDVPCSGEGMMRKDDEAVAQWSPQLVDQCAERQRGILSDAWNALRPGGLLIYSTCTYNRQENEEIADFIVNELGATSLEVPIEPSWNIHPAIGSDAHCYRFMPHRVDGEGLFMTVFRKDGDAPRQDIRLKGKNTKKCDEIGKNWLANPDHFAIEQQGDLFIASPVEWRNEISAFRSSLNVLHAGLELATVMGRKTMPHHALAMSSARAMSSLPMRVQCSALPTTWVTAPTTSTPNPNASSAPTSPTRNPKSCKKEDKKYLFSPYQANSTQRRQGAKMIVNIRVPDKTERGCLFNP